MKSVRQLLEGKGYDVWAIGPDARVYDALKLMAEQEVGALLVLEGGGIAGIMSERDYARKVVLKEKSAIDTPVREIMTPNVVTVRPDQTLGDCMALMTDRHIRHLPVVQDDQLIGIISIGDVVKAVISEQELLIQQLENYIAGQ